jgi:hypothetical protein
MPALSLCSRLGHLTRRYHVTREFKPGLVPLNQTQRPSSPSWQDARIERRLKMDSDYDSDTIPDWMDSLTSDEVINTVTTHAYRLTMLRRFRTEPELLVLFQDFVVSIDPARAEWALTWLTKYLADQVGRTTSNNNFQSAHEFLKEEWLPRFIKAIDRLRDDDSLLAALASRNYANRQAQKKLADAVEKEAARYRTEQSPVKIATAGLLQFQEYQKNIAQVYKVLVDLKGVLQWDTNPASGKLASRKARWESSIVVPFNRLGKDIADYKRQVQEWQDVSVGGPRYTTDPAVSAEARQAVEEAAETILNTVQELQSGIADIAHRLQKYAAAKAVEKYAKDYASYDSSFNEGMTYFNAASQNLGVATAGLAMLFPPLAAIPLSISAANFLTNQIAPTVRAKRKLKNDPQAIARVLTTTTAPEKKYFSTANILRSDVENRFEQRFGGLKDQLLNLNTAQGNTGFVADTASYLGSHAGKLVSGALGGPALAPLTPLGYGAGMTLTILRAQPKELIEGPGQADLIAGLSVAGHSLQLADDDIEILGPDGNDPTKWRISLNGDEVTFDPATKRIYDSPEIFLNAWGSGNRKQSVWNGQLQNEATANSYEAYAEATVYSAIATGLSYDAEAGYFYASMETSFTIYVDVGRWVKLTSALVPAAAPLAQRRQVTVGLSADGSLMYLYDPAANDQDLDISAEMATVTVPTSVICDVLSDDLITDTERNPFLAQGYYASIESFDIDDVTWQAVTPSNNPIPDVDAEYFDSWRTAADSKLKENG